MCDFFSLPVFELIEKAKQEKSASLNLSHKDLEVLPEELSELEGLEVASLDKLEWLIISGNPIEEIPPGIKGRIDR